VALWNKVAFGLGYFCFLPEHPACGRPPIARKSLQINKQVFFAVTIIGSVTCCGLAGDSGFMFFP
jgi:hypothetical protein